MICNKCGAENPEHEKVCLSCGALLGTPVAKPNPEPAPEPEKPELPAKKGGKFTLPPIPEEALKARRTGPSMMNLVAAAALLVLGYMNYRDMKLGNSYFVWFGILPAHFILIPIGILLFVLWLKERNDKKKEKQGEEDPKK